MKRFAALVLLALWVFLACGAAEEIVEGMRAGLWAIEQMIASMEDGRQ